MTGAALLRSVLITLLVLVSGNVPRAAGDELYFVDAHSQVDQDVPLDLVIRRMDEAGVYRTILSTRGRRPAADVVHWASQHPDRIIPALRTKGRAYISGQKGYFTELDNQVRSGRYQAMAEVLLFHARKGKRAPEVAVDIDDPRVDTTLAAAVANGWPFIAHIEFAALYGERRTRFMSGLERLLGDQRGHPFALIHMGQLGAPEVARLITAHPNLHFLTSHASPRVAASSQPWVNMFSGEGLADDWRALIERHPDRFVFAIDNVWPEHWKHEYGREIARWRRALGMLPPAVASAIAHGNAERLWRLVPKPSTRGSAVR